MKTINPMLPNSLCKIRLVPSAIGLGLVTLGAVAQAFRCHPYISLTVNGIRRLVYDDLRFVRICIRRQNQLPVAGIERIGSRRCHSTVLPAFRLKRRVVISLEVADSRNRAVRKFRRVTDSELQPDSPRRSCCRAGSSLAFREHRQRSRHWMPLSPRHPPLSYSTDYKFRSGRHQNQNL